jgi:acyl dehydratase
MADDGRGDPTMIDPNRLRVGDHIPPFRRQTGFDLWNRYAAVNDEFVPIHMDDEAGRSAGYPSAFGMGNLQWAFLHNVLRQWAGDGARIVRLACQFRGANVRGQTVTAHGTITALRPEGEEVLVDLDVWTEQQDGLRLAPGQATIALPRDADTPAPGTGRP